MGAVLDARVYRAAFLPAFFLLFVAAFALENRPAPAVTTFAPEGFDAARAFGEGNTPPRNSLRELATAFPRRAPASSGDRLLADRVAEELARDGRFEVSRQRAPADTAKGEVTLETVIGVRPGLSNRRIVVVAHRDAAGSPATAELSATATLLELARIAERREVRKTLVLVSTSGGSVGGAGARAWAQDAGDPQLVDGVLVLGDLASRETHRPWVVPWSNDERPAPHDLRRTVERAARAEVGTDPGSARALVQWVRRALPLTYSEQGELVAAGFPAVLLQASGERGPDPDNPISRESFDAFGRTALRALTALDERVVAGEDRAGAESNSPYSRETDGIVTFRKVLPTWAVRLLLLGMLLPAVLAALDACMREQRSGRHPWRRLAWAAAGATAFLAAWAWARILDLTGLLDAPRAAAAPGSIPIDAAAVAAMLTTVAVAVVGWFALRRLIARVTGVGPWAGDGTAAAAVSVLIVALCAVLLWTNPYAGALLVPAAHLWPLAMAERPPRWARLLLIFAGLALPVAALGVYGWSLRMAPLELAWMWFLSAAGGAVEFGSAVAVCLFTGALCSAVVIARDRPRSSHTSQPAITRGPISYAGPGSLGGTDSALRR